MPPHFHLHQLKTSITDLKNSFTEYKVSWDQYNESFLQVIQILQTEIQTLRNPNTDPLPPCQPQTHPQQPPTDSTSFNLHTPIANFDQPPPASQNQHQPTPHSNLAALSMILGPSLEPVTDDLNQKTHPQQHPPQPVTIATETTLEVTPNFAAPKTHEKSKELVTEAEKVEGEYLVLCRGVHQRGETIVVDIDSIDVELNRSALPHRFNLLGTEYLGLPLKLRSTIIFGFDPGGTSSTELPWLNVVEDDMDLLNDQGRYIAQVGQATTNSHDSGSGYLLLGDQDNSAVGASTFALSAELQPVFIFYPGDTITGVLHYSKAPWNPYFTSIATFDNKNSPFTN